MGFGSTVVLAAIAWAAAPSPPCAPLAARSASARVAALEDPALPADWEPVREYRGAAVDTIRENFPNGRVRRVACYLAGRRDALAQHGPEWTWWPNGAVQGRRFLVQGKQDGPSVSYYESGVIESRGEFLEDGRHGQWNFFNEQGVLKAIRNYDHGEPHGQFLTLFANGTPKLEAEFEHGLQTGVEREWSIDGDVVREAHYRAGKLDGPLERIEILAKRPAEPGAAPEDADAIRKERRLENYSEGLKSGTWLQWDENGTQILEEHYVKDQLHGLRSKWRADGTLAVRTTYTEGRMEGELTAWYDNGQMQMQGELVDGKRTGIWHYWRLDGSPIEAWSGRYEADLKVSD